MIRPPDPSALQEATLAFHDVLLDARGTLDPASFRVFVDFVCAAIAHEAARCANWEHRHPEDESA